MMSAVMERTAARLEGKLADLYRAHAPAAARLAFLMTGDAARAEDLVHDAFVKMIGRFGDIRDTGPGWTNRLRPCFAALADVAQGTRSARRWASRFSSSARS
jgi:predicted component of type VI protein secretion system